jgi:hypothetical protein
MCGRLILMLFIIAILFLSLGFICCSRKQDNRDLEQRLEERSLSKKPQVMEAYRGTELKIVFFYAYPGAINKGQKTQLCYGVINSEKVRIEPPVEDVYPALAKCVDVTPKSTTAYKLIAEDAKGNTKQADTKIEVH